MNLCLLHLDEALLAQPAFMKACGRHDALHCELQDVGKEIRLWASDNQMEHVKDALRSRLNWQSKVGPMVAWMGSGDFHHVSALLVELIAEQHDVPITVVHFDNHPDWVECSSGMHCGSWVKRLLDNDTVERVVTIGVNSRDLVWPDLKRAGIDHVRRGRHVLYSLRELRYSPTRRRGRSAEHFHVITAEFSAPGCMAEIQSQVGSTIPTERIYITIDKDVLRSSDAKTNWDQGMLSLECLQSWLSVLLRRYRVLGVDVIGDYSPQAFTGPMPTRFLKKTELALDQPWFHKRDSASALNECGNLRLLETLGALRC